MFSARSLLIFLSSALAVSALPQQTASPTGPSDSTNLGTTTIPPSSTITSSPALSCSDGSTILYTTECTMGYPISYCHSPEPPIQCSTGSFPSVWHPGHCMTQSTCFPVTADWITTSCKNGGIPYSTTTLFQGTLAGGTSTIISQVYCSCAANQWYSWTLLPGSSTMDSFCMPYSACAAGMTTSISTNEYCASTPASCPGIPTTTPFCKCASPTEHAVYPPGGSVATGCAA